MCYSGSTKAQIIDSIIETMPKPLDMILKARDQRVKYWMFLDLLHFVV